MGWSGYGLYDGDGTHSIQLEFVNKAGLSGYVDWEYSDGDIVPNYLAQSPPIKLIPEHKKVIIKAYSKLMKDQLLKRPKRGQGLDMEDWSINWQMFVDMIVANRMPLTKEMKSNALEANELLMGNHAECFNEPAKRKRHLRNFEKKVKKYRVSKVK